MEVDDVEEDAVQGGKMMMLRMKMLRKRKRVMFSLA